MRRVLPSLFGALDAMRGIDLSAASGFGGWRADGSTTHSTWRAKLLGIDATRRPAAPQGGARCSNHLRVDPLGVIPTPSILEARRQAGEARHDDANLRNPDKERFPFRLREA
jgi:hypothetical protein